MSTQIAIDPKTVIKAAKIVAQMHLDSIQKQHKRDDEEYLEYVEQGRTWWGRLWRIHPALRYMRSYYPSYKELCQRDYERAKGLITAAKMCKGEMLLSADDAAFITVEYVTEKQGSDAP